MSRPNKQTGPKSPQERKHGGQWEVKTRGREGIHINDCTDTLFFFIFIFSGLGKWFCILHCPRCSVNYIVIVILTWGRTEHCANIKIILNHPGKICDLLYGWWANLYLSSTGRWGAAGRGATTAGTVDRSQGKVVFSWKGICLHIGENSSSNIKLQHYCLNA